MQTFCIPIVTLSNQVNVKLLQQPKSGSNAQFIGTNFNQKHQYKDEINISIGWLISFQGTNRLFVLLFWNNEQQTNYKQYFLVNIEIKYYNLIIGGKGFFDQPLKMIWEYLITFKKLQQVKEIIT